MKKKYWFYSEYATEISTLIEAHPIFYGCSIKFLEDHVKTASYLQKR